MPGINLEGQIPVFVYPSSLTFCIHDESTHKQVLTIYNPYDFAINYLLLSNAPENYYIPDSSGLLNPRNRIDIVVRHRHAQSNNLGTSDKIRIQVTESGKSKVIGRKDIAISVVQSHPDKGHFDTENFEALPRRLGPDGSSPTQRGFGSVEDTSNAESWFSTQIVLVVLCLAALMMPTEGEGVVSIVPPILHLTTAFKNVASFILGIVVCCILNTLNK